MVEALRNGWRANCEGRAKTSLYHQQFLTLDFELGERSFLRVITDININACKIKARAELIDLNFIPWLEGRNYECSLCNSQENETVFRFVGRCPVLEQFRKSLPWERTNDHHKFETYLNVRNWLALKGLLPGNLGESLSGNLICKH